MPKHTTIGNIQIHTQYYKGSDTYSDGDVENEILGIVKSKDFDLEGIIEQDDRWPILYHFTPIRRNILEWYDFNPQGSLLEIGAGCGAVTGLFSDKLTSVTAIEMSMRRAEILANRYRDRKNIEIIVGDLFDIELDQQYDYITLIGVLEYAAMNGAENPYHRFLSKVRTLLKPNGILFIAIENKYGLKYWSGSLEDHTGTPFDSIENYQRTNQTVRTFSKKELSDLLKASGFGEHKFYYPVPDYKLPDAVYSENYLPKRGQYVKESPNYDAVRIKLFNERITMDSIIDNDMFGFFSNSFLVKVQL